MNSETGGKDRRDIGATDGLPSLSEYLHQQANRLRGIGHGRLTIELTARDGKIVHADATVKESQRLDTTDQTYNPDG